MKPEIPLNLNQKATGYEHTRGRYFMAGEQETCYIIIEARSYKDSITKTTLAIKRASFLSFL
jgi:hypothetical protein